MDETLETVETPRSIDASRVAEQVYMQADIDAAVNAGVFSRDVAVRLREFVMKRHALAAAGQAASEADEEHFRLLNGFNDIFVAIAIGLTLGALYGLLPAVLSDAAIVVVSWALAEYFTRRRRMALPSIILSLSFAVSVLVLATFVLTAIFAGLHANAPQILELLPAGVIAAAAAGLHWRRFKVPIDVATGAGVLVVPVLMRILLNGDGMAMVVGRVVVLLIGLFVFAFALRWDISDRERVTRRSDVAFWLHLLAAPLIVHPVFLMIGLCSDTVGIGAAIAAIGVYIVLAVIALVIDRRSLLVSALAYMLYAVYMLFHLSGSTSEDNIGLALTALIVGVLLLFLSALWRSARQLVVERLPARAHAWLPRT